MRRKCWLAIGLAAMMLIGCQTSPAESIVVNKDINKLIEEAKTAGESEQDLSKLVEKGSLYRAELSDETLDVTVKAEAEIFVPEVEQLNIYRVKKATITQEFLDLVRETLAPDVTWYDGAVLERRTRESYEDEIRICKEMIVNAKDPVIKEEYQRYLDQLQVEYEIAEDKVSWEGFLSDGKIHTAKELYERDVDDDFYEWEYSLNPDGEVYYGINQGSEGEYISLFVQNNPELGNRITYRKSQTGHEFVAVAGVGMLELRANQPWTGFSPLDENDGIQSRKISITQMEAIQQAETLLDQLKITDFQFCEGRLFLVKEDTRWNEGDGFRTCYVLQYTRSLDGGVITQASESKYEESRMDGAFTKYSWGVENIEIWVSDDGIVCFEYNEPLEVVEVVVSDVAVLSFSEIVDRFEKMATLVCTAYEKKQQSVWEGLYEIDCIELGYTLVSEPYNYETGLLVPTWDFTGPRGEDFGSIDYNNFVTINAIDGSIIDRMAGY